jgi:hypothetical protein
MDVRMPPELTRADYIVQFEYRAYGAGVSAAVLDARRAVAGGGVTGIRTASASSGPARLVPGLLT